MRLKCWPCEDKKRFRSSVQVIIYNINITGEKKRKEISIINRTEWKSNEWLGLGGKRSGLIEEGGKQKCKPRVHSHNYSWFFSFFQYRLYKEWTTLADKRQRPPSRRNASVSQGTLEHWSRNKCRSWRGIYEARDLRYRWRQRKHHHHHHGEKIGSDSVHVCVTTAASDFSTRQLSAQVKQRILHIRMALKTPTHSTGAECSDSAPVDAGFYLHFLALYNWSAYRGQCTHIFSHTHTHTCNREPQISWHQCNFVFFPFFFCQNRSSSSTSKISSQDSHSW